MERVRRVLPTKSDYALAKALERAPASRERSRAAPHPSRARLRRAHAVPHDRSRRRRSRLRARRKARAAPRVGSSGPRACDGTRQNGHAPAQRRLARCDRGEYTQRLQGEQQHQGQDPIAQAIELHDRQPRPGADHQGGRSQHHQQRPRCVAGPRPGDRESGAGRRRRCSPRGHREGARARGRRPRSAPPHPGSKARWSACGRSGAVRSRR